MMAHWTAMGNVSSPLTSLPPELLLVVFEELSYADILRCSRLSRYCHKLIQGSSSLQYTIELASAGMEDRPSNKLSKTFKRDLLKKYQRSLKALRGKHVTRQDIPLMEGPLWELCGGVLAQSRGRRTLEFKQLPSTIRGIEFREWTADVDFDVADFSMDPSQNLLVALEAKEDSCDAHILTILAGEAHPLASNRRLTFRAPLVNPQDRNYHIRISGDYVGVLVRIYDHENQVYEDEFAVMNWKTGALELSLTRCDITSFTFLSSNHIVLAHAVGTHDDYVVVLMVVDFTAGNQNAHTPKRYITLRLPVLNDRWDFYNVEVVSDPSPSWTSALAPSLSTSSSISSSISSSPSASKSLKSKAKLSAAEETSILQNNPPPFQIAQDERIVAIRLSAVDTWFDDGRDDAQDLIIPSKTLISLLLNNTSTPVHRPDLQNIPHIPIYTRAPSTHIKIEESEPVIPITATTAVHVPSQLHSQPYPQQTQPSTHTIAVDLPWHKWGPPNTRLIPSQPSCVWCYPVYGTKYVTKEKGYLVVYDFNELAIDHSLSMMGVPLSTQHNSRSSSPVGGGQSLIYRESSRGGLRGSTGTGGVGEIVKGAMTMPTKMFRDSVVSGLGCRKFKTCVSVARSDSVMISEDSVVVVQGRKNNFRITSL